MIRDRQSRGEEEKTIEEKQKVWYPLMLGFLIPFVLFIVTYPILHSILRTNRDGYSCGNKAKTSYSSKLLFDANQIGKIKGTVPSGKVDCFSFFVAQGQELNVSTNVPLRVTQPGGSSVRIDKTFQKTSNEEGLYRIGISGIGSEVQYEVEVALKGSTKTSYGTNLPTIRIGNSVSSPESIKKKENSSAPKSLDSSDVSSEPEKNTTTSYSVKPYAPLQTNPALETIVNSAVTYANDRNLPAEDLSVTLIDLNTDTRADYQGQILRFPASTVKLFWLVALLENFEMDQTFEGAVTQKDVSKMMQDSDNNSASRILDQLTQTESGESLPPEELRKWAYQRESINRFYQDADYSDINISQKNFPITDLSLPLPAGRDKQIREYGEDVLTRNALTSDSLARLLFEIERAYALSESYSRYVKQLMRRDFVAESQKEYDSIIGFLGGGLDPKKVSLYSKPGWTSDSRQDAAIIYSADQSIKYILVVMGSGSAYSKDEKIFPEISKYIYDQMTYLAEVEK